MAGGFTGKHLCSDEEDLSVRSLFSYLTKSLLILIKNCSYVIILKRNKMPAGTYKIEHILSRIPVCKAGKMRTLLLKLGVGTRIFLI